MPHTETETHTGTGVMTPPKGKDCSWVKNVLRFVRGAHYRKCEGNEWVDYSESITHTVVPNTDGTCAITITTVTTKTYTGEPCEFVAVNSPIGSMTQGSGQDPTMDEAIRVCEAMKAKYGASWHCTPAEWKTRYDACRASGAGVIVCASLASASCYLG